MEEKPLFKCTVCPAEFKTQRGLDNHIHRWICQKCFKKFKTAKGYDKHVATNCNISTKAAKEKKRQLAEAERQAALREEFDELLAQMKEKNLLNPKYHVGQQLFVSGYYVTKPTHEQRFNRQVRVRYEEERRYIGEQRTVQDVIGPDVRDLWTMKSCLENGSEYQFYYNFGYSFKGTRVHETLEEAVAYAQKQTQDYKESCDFASRCR